MPSASDYIEMFERLQAAHLHCNQNACVNVRNRNAGCTRCANACPSGCISIADNQITIEAQRCIGCGTCATTCPSGALIAAEPSDVQLFEMSLAAIEAAGGVLVIACSQLLERASGRYDPAKVVGVSCLGRIEETLIVDMVKRGAKRVDLVSGDCDGCSYKNGVMCARSVVANANLLLEVWGQKERCQLKEKLPALTKIHDDGFDASKRGFFQNVKGIAKSTASIGGQYAMEKTFGTPEIPERYTSVEPDGTLPHRLPERRMRIINLLRSFTAPIKVRIQTRLFGQVDIDPEKCTSCYMCATFCPTGALLKIQREDVFVGIAHRAAFCVHCRCCENICPKDAIELSDIVYAPSISEGTIDYFEMDLEKHPEDAPDAMFSAISTLMDFSNSIDLGA